MTQYNSLNVKVSNSQLNQLKSAIKKKLGDETNFPHELLLTSRQVANLRQAFANNSSTDTKLSKTQLSKIVQSGEFVGRLLRPLLKIGLLLIQM